MGSEDEQLVSGVLDADTLVGGPKAFIAFPFRLSDGISPAFSVAFMMFVGMLLDPSLLLVLGVGVFVVLIAVRVGGGFAHGVAHAFLGTRGTSEEFGVGCASAW